MTDFPEIAELLGFQKDDDGRLRFLRKAQLKAIEVYFYLRMVLGNQHVRELYSLANLDQDIFLMLTY